jgi:hypothetical protein
VPALAVDRARGGGRAVFSGTKKVDGREATVKVALTDAAGRQELTVVLIRLS